MKELLIAVDQEQYVKDYTEKDEASQVSGTQEIWSFWEWTIPAREMFPNTHSNIAKQMISVLEDIR